MTLLLTILTVLAVWTLLAVLAMGLFLILKVLQNVRGYLEKIAWGVRAIEHQLAPLRKQAEETDAALRETESAFASATQRLGQTSHLLDALPPSVAGL